MVSDLRARPDVAAAYGGVLLIWSTTPLGIKWSTELGFVQGLAIRMLIATVLLVLIQLAMRRRLPLDRGAVLTYLAGSLGIFWAMLSVYWAAQHLPSGLMAVVFGMAPMFTALMSALLLGERGDLLRKVAGGAIGIAGLALIFSDSLAVPPGARLAILAVLLAAVLYGLGAVLMKRIASEVDHVSMTTGSMLVCAPLFIITWWWLDLSLPVAPPLRAVAAVLYLSVAGSVVGFMLYFYLLKHVRASSAALITLVTPVAALLLGAWLNDETLPLNVWWGVVVILAGLALFNAPMRALASVQGAVAADPARHQHDQ